MMPDNWQPGDLAECIDVQDFVAKNLRGEPCLSNGGRDLALGMIYIVQAIARDADDDRLLLDVAVKTGPKAAHRFRRIPPLVEEPPVTLEQRRERELVDG